jgi:hypothetical protein
MTMHVTNIFTKLHVVSRTQAALWAVREGLVQVVGEWPSTTPGDQPAARRASRIGPGSGRERRVATS